MRRDLFYRLLALAVLAIVVVPVGVAVFVLGFVHGDSPCVLCWAQRTAMVLIALMGLFVLRYGPRPRYLGLSVLIAGWGVFMGIRHSAGHVVRDVGQGFSVVLLGAHTYIWSVAIFWSCVMAMGLLLLVLRDGDAIADRRTPRALDRLAMWAFLIVVGANIVQAFASTGPPPYMGQSDPVRFSFNPRYWVWSLEEWHPAPISLRGRWAIEQPSLEGLEADPQKGPLGPLPRLAVRSQRRLTLNLPAPITDLAYQPDGDRFALTTRDGIYLADAQLSTVQRSTVIDRAFSVDLNDFAGVAWLDAQTVIALSQNKSYVVEREAGNADAVKNYRFFLESPEAFEELARSRFATIRGRMMYVMSLASDPQAAALYTVTVPNAKVRTLVVSQFDRRDMVLSAEFSPRVDPASGLALPEGRSLAEYYVTATTAAGGRLYALSAAYSTLLTIDPAAGAVVAAHGIDGIARPVGLAVRGGDLVIVDGDGTLWTVAMP